MTRRCLHFEECHQHICDCGWDAAYHDYHHAAAFHVSVAGTAAMASAVVGGTLEMDIKSIKFKTRNTLTLKDFLLVLMNKNK